MFKKFLKIFLIAIFCVISFTTEAIVVDKRPVTVGISYFSENEIAKAMINGAKKATKKYNGQLYLRNGRGETDVQIAQIHDLIAQGTNCLVIICEDENNNRFVENAEKANVPVVVLKKENQNKETAFNAAYQAVEEVIKKYKAKPVESAFYSGY